MFKVQDINVYLIKFLSNKDHVNLMLVNKKFNEGFNDDIIYKNKIENFATSYKLKIYRGVINDDICYKKSYLDILKSKELLIKLFGDDTYKKIEEKDLDDIKKFVNDIKDDQISYFYFMEMYFYHASKYLTLHKSEVENLKIFKQSCTTITKMRSFMTKLENITVTKILVNFSDYLDNLK